MWMNVGIVVVAVLFGMIGFYLSLIAKFYRLKFGRGPRAVWLQAALAATVAGILLRLEAFSSVPDWIPAALATGGGLAFAALAYRLYRIMMSA
jgi:hypothetical protein